MNPRTSNIADRTSNIEHRPSNIADRTSNIAHHTFPNGLTLLAAPDPDAHTAAVGFFVRTGARDEAPERMGVSHFLEHMMFKSTTRGRTAEDINRTFDEIGANYNAYTSHENTVYYAHVLPELLPQAVDLLTDMLRPALTDEDFNLERNVILEEIGMYEDRPSWRLHDALFERYFHRHPMGHRILGTQASIRALTAPQMRHYFQQRYEPGNIIVAAAGRLDLAALTDDLARRTAPWPGSPTHRDFPPLTTPPSEPVDLIDDKLERHYVSFLCPAPSAQDDLRYAAQVLSHLLGDSDGSRLYWNLIDPGLADEADFSYMPQDQLGLSIGFASCDPERAREVEGVLLKTLDELAADPALLRDEEIERAKVKLATDGTLSNETPMGRMRDLGGQWLYLGEYLPLDEQIHRLMAVTRDDLAAVMARYPFSPRTLMRLGPAAVG